MGNATKATSALPYMQQLIDDEYVRRQIGQAAIGLRDAYQRVAVKRAEAVDDTKLYSSLRRAATSVRNAITALRKPEPPPKRRGRKLLVVVIAATGAAMLTRVGRERQIASTTSDTKVRADAAANDGASPKPETIATGS